MKRPEGASGVSSLLQRSSVIGLEQEFSQKLEHFLSRLPFRVTYTRNMDEVIFDDEVFGRELIWRMNYRLTAMNNLAQIQELMSKNGWFPRLRQTRSQTIPWTEGERRKLVAEGLSLEEAFSSPGREERVATDWEVHRRYDRKRFGLRQVNDRLILMDIVLMPNTDFKWFSSEVEKLRKGLISPEQGWELFSGPWVQNFKYKVRS